VLAFEYPWVFLIIPLPILVWVLLPPYREEQEAVRIPFFDQLAELTGLKPTPGAVILKTNILQKLVAPIAWLLIVAALACPQWIEDPIERIESARDLMLAVDLSQSMEVRDFVDPEGNRIDRLEAVKLVLDDFITRREGDRIGLIVFGGAAYPQVPFTLDHASCRILLEQARIGMAGPRTSIGDAIGLAIQQFEAGQVEERVLILLTDGNDTGSKMPPLKAAEIAAQNGILIHTIGIGDPQASGEDKVDLEALGEIAESTGGRSFRGEDLEQLEQIYATLDEMTPHNYERFTYRPKIPLYYWPLGIAVGLMVAYHVLMHVLVLLARLKKTPVNVAGEQV